ncbi:MULTISPECIES: DUF417 family protein [unclassified Bradyrhizobium]|uniref:DUF417 family protein n=1 Tax=unclassified Bradyrhizobium TaxID=2631580 RepID=UPI002FF3C264
MRALRRGSAKVQEGGLFVTTISFMISTPGVVVPELGLPAITVAPGQFLLKDVGLFAACSGYSSTL